MSDFIGVYANAASDDYCDRMMARLDQLIIESSGFAGEDANGGLGNRKDVSRYFERDDQELATETNQVLDKSLNMYMDEHLLRDCFIKIEEDKNNAGVCIPVKDI